MKTTDIKTNLIDSYFTILKSLSPDNKLDLISRLSESLKTSKKNKDVSLNSLYGSWVSEQTADELIKELKKARTFQRKREEI